MLISAANKGALGRSGVHHAVTHASRWAGAGLSQRAIHSSRPITTLTTSYDRSRPLLTPITLSRLYPSTLNNNRFVTSRPVIARAFSHHRSCNAPLIHQKIHLRIQSASSRQKSTDSKPSRASQASDQRLDASSKTSEASKASNASSSNTNTPPEPPSDYSPQGLFNRLPNVSFHSPTKEELLAAATGFWSRLSVRFKWFSIRSARPFNVDDISAFATWFLAGHVIWILVGTTTFFSLVILAVNTVFAQETLAGWVGDYLTKSSGARVVFESAIVPKWKDGVITFKNVFVSRRPGQKQSKVRKGSQAAAAAQAGSLDPIIVSEDEDTNYTQFDVSIDTVNVTLSFARWVNGKGMLRDVEMKGVRGVVDRTHVVYGDNPVDPRSYLHEHATGDFELESFKLDDLLVSVYQPKNFRPFSVSIFSADLPQLRKQWMFYDFLSANHISGSFDESLFTIHPRQTHATTGASLQADNAGQWKKQSRIRIDGLNIDHLNRGVEGPFSWIHEGNVDIVADIMFPAENEESIAKVMSDFYDRMEATVSSNRIFHPAQRPQDQIRADESTAVVDTTTHGVLADDTKDEDPNAKRFLVMDLRVHLNDVHASVPLFTRDLSYVNNALIRPIVAYINNKKQFIPVNCRVVKRLSEFDGSWTIYDSALMDDLSRETYDAFARDVVDDQQRMRRIKKVGIWSLQLAVQALFLGLAGHVA